VVKFGTKFGTKYLLHNLVPNLVMLPTCNHCCKLIRQVMVSSGFVQVMVSLWWIYCPFCKFGTKFVTKFGTKYLLHNLVPNLVMLATCNHCCKLIRQVMVSSGFVQGIIVVDLLSIL